MDPIINKSSFGPGQQEEMTRALAAYIMAMAQIAPQLSGHFLSGGTFEIKTMSGMHLKVGFNPMSGGLILPGGIAPIQNGGLIK
jgi:hypothetical protein